MEVHGITVIFFSKSVTTNVQKGGEVEPDKKSPLGCIVLANVCEMFLTVVCANNNLKDLWFPRIFMARQDERQHPAQK